MKTASKPSSPPAEKEKQFITQPALVERWKISAVTLWRYRKEGKLKAYKLDRRGIRYDLAQVIAVESQSAA